MVVAVLWGGRGCAIDILAYYMISYLVYDMFDYMIIVSILLCNGVVVALSKIDWKTFACIAVSINKRLRYKKKV